MKETGVRAMLSAKYAGLRGGEPRPESWENALLAPCSSSKEPCSLPRLRNLFVLGALRRPFSGLSLSPCQGHFLPSQPDCPPPGQGPCQVQSLLPLANKGHTWVAEGTGEMDRPCPKPKALVNWSGDETSTTEAKNEGAGPAVRSQESWLSN